MGVRIERSQPHWWLRDVEISYDLMPQEAFDLLPGSNCDIKSWPEDQMCRWNGGKTGVVKADIPLLRLPQAYATDQGRQRQEESGIGFSLPVEIASLALPQNEPAKTQLELNKQEKMWALVVLGQSDEKLLQLCGSSWSFCLYLYPYYFKFNLVRTDYDWGGDNVLAGAPQVPM